MSNRLAATSRRIKIHPREIENSVRRNKVIRHIQSRDYSGSNDIIDNNLEYRRMSAERSHVPKKISIVLETAHLTHRRSQILNGFYDHRLSQSSDQGVKKSKRINKAQMLLGLEPTTDEDMLRNVIYTKEELDLSFKPESMTLVEVFIIVMYVCGVRRLVL